jgi:GNAT superfamily N-acetyltransferase
MKQAGDHGAKCARRSARDAQRAAGAAPAAAPVHTAPTPGAMTAPIPASATVPKTALQMMKIRIHPATSDRFDAVRAVLCPNDNPRACWCLTYRLPNAENSGLVGRARAQRMRVLCAATPAPGVLAYVDEQPAGWCAIGPRADYPRLARSKTIPRLDDVPVWSIVCLVVRAGFRRRGVARELVGGAVDYAFAQGARMIEAYPIETAGRRVSATLAYTGTTRLFAAAGFVPCAPTQARSAGLPRVLMRYPCHGRAAGA